MAFTLCTSGSAIAKAGTHANATLILYGGNNKTIIDAYSDEIENELCSISRYNLITNYGSLTTNGKQLLNQLSSCMIAQHILAYDMSGYIPFGEAVAILNVLENQVVRQLAILTNDKNKTFLGIAS